MSKKEQDQYFEENPGSRKKRRHGAGKTVLIILFVFLLIGGGGVYLIRHYVDLIPRIDTRRQSTLSPSEAQELINRETESAASESADTSTNAAVREVTVDPNETYVVEINGETKVVSGSEVNANPDYNVVGQFEWKKAEPLEDKDLINVMLLGIDARKTGDQTRTDTMILISVNPKSHEIAMVSFMRDLYLPIHEGYEDSRLNHAYEIGGLQFLYDCLENNFGLHIDGSVVVDFKQFAKIIDILGGVDITLTAKEAEHLKENVIDFTGNSTTSAASLHEGSCHLDGNTALAYCRIRKIDDDFHRTARQRNVLTALFGKVKSAGIRELNEILNTVIAMSATDLSNSDILSYAASVLPYLGSASLESGRIPCDGSYRSVYINSMSVVQAVQQSNLDYLKSVLPFGN